MDTICGIANVVWGQKIDLKAEMIMKRYLILISIFVALVSCQRSFDEPSRGDSQHFTFQLASYADSLSGEGSRGANTSELTQLVAGVYNPAGALVSSVIMSQSPDLTKLSIEGLVDGDYTAVFIAVAEQRTAQKPTIVMPSQIDGQWLADPTSGMPHNNEYLYAKSQFTIKNNNGVSSNITLQRIVARIDIEPDFTDQQWTKGSITSMRITFSDGSVYTTHNADGTYGNAAGEISNFEVVDHFSLYTLPTVGDMPGQGSLLVVGNTGDGSQHSILYDFELTVQANKRVTIRPAYDLKNDQFGTVRVYDKDRNALNSKKFFQDPTNKTHHYQEIPKHSFKMNGLLKLTYQNNNKQLKAQFYSILPVKNVTVYARRSSDAEFFEVAWFESMQPLEERTINLSTSPDNRVYRTESGGAIFIDKMVSDLEYKYVSNDPHMKKLASIKWPLKIMFRTPTNDTLYNREHYLPFRAVYAREAVAMWTNLAYMYSHQLWEDKMLETERNSPFLENGKVVSIRDVFIPQVFNKASNNYAVLGILNMNNFLGMATIGVGDNLSLRPDKVYTSHYLEDQDSWEQLYNVGLHEYGHNLGYNHEGDFTYNKCTTVNVACMKALVKELPYPSSKLLNSLSNPNLYVGIPNRD